MATGQQGGSVWDLDSSAPFVGPCLSHLRTKFLSTGLALIGRVRGGLELAGVFWFTN